MKRSQINAAIRKAKSLLEKQRFYLPEFAEWTPADWEVNKKESEMIVRNGLGWDITDFGLDRFDEIGANDFYDTQRQFTTTEDRHKLCGENYRSGRKPDDSHFPKPRISLTGVRVFCASNFLIPIKTNQ